MNRSEVISSAEEFVRLNIDSHDSGHDWWHIHRVRNLAAYICRAEGKGDPLAVELAALFHDIGDSKFSKGKEADTVAVIRNFLIGKNVSGEMIEQVIYINLNISLSKKVISPADHPEFHIVQDADRLDAIGAIGIARAFSYGGFRNNSIYDPDNGGPSTIAHFYEKLLLLKGLMNTETGRIMAEERHRFLEVYLEEFHREWNTGASRS